MVDDGSSDQTFLRALPYHRRRGVEFRVLAKPNGGKFDALNHGIARARGEIVICIDGDSVLASRRGAPLRGAFRRPVRRRRGRPRACREPRHGLVCAAGARVHRGIRPCQARAERGARRMHRSRSARRLPQERARRKCSGYDGDSFAEDFDLTMKLLGAGWHIVYEPRAVVFDRSPGANARAPAPALPLDARLAAGAEKTRTLAAHAARQSAALRGRLLSRRSSASPCPRCMSRHRCCSWSADSCWARTRS